MLSKKAVLEQGKIMLDWRAEESERLNELYLYLHGEQRFTWLSNDAPDEARRIQKIARLNVLPLVIDTVAQSMYVEGYRAPKGEGEAPSWKLWQQNRLDARQIGVHRASLSYGASYTTVLPGEPMAAIRGVSPRFMTTVYDEGEDWPMWALEKRRSEVPDRQLFRLFDDEALYWFSCDTQGDHLEFISSEVHDLGKVPVIRFLNKADLDREITAELDDLMVLQDQIDMTTFSLLMVQHYGAFPQRWIAGWTPADEDEERKVGMNRFLTFGDPNTRSGQFEAASLDGYIKSRESSLRELAAISQTPAHALRGELINLSAEALAAAEATERRKIDERTTLAGESWEQTLELGGTIEGYQTVADAQVRWKDTEARAFAATVDGLGKLAEMLEVPKQMLWEKIPGWTQQDVDRAQVLLEQGDTLGLLTKELQREFTATSELQVPGTTTEVLAAQGIPTQQGAGA